MVYFNPRTPCGVRLAGLPSRRCMPLFQSTHPLRGATASMRSTSISPINFNPRTPCGVRLMNERVNITLEGFQSTHPLRGATDSKRLFLRGYEISIHAPLAGCDVRGRRDRRGLFHISIHAPLAGCDSPHGAFQNKVVNFNPRTPCGVRQRQELRSVEATEISIHAPLAGCDSKIAEIFPANLRKSYKISAKPNKERRCRVLGKGKAAAISDLARCEPPGENRNASGSHQIMSAPSGA